MRSEPFFSGIRLDLEQLEEDEYPLTVPAVRQLTSVKFHPAVTVFAGENGAGKSTLIEAIAVAAGFNAEGGTKNFRTETESTNSRLADAITLGRNANREQDGFFLRAESTYVLMSYLNQTDPENERSRPVSDYYGGDLHQLSHGESFMQLFETRFAATRNALFIVDEIESALSPMRQFEFLGLMHRHVERGSSFIVSTHSPILMSYPRSRLYWLDERGMEERNWKDTEHFRIYNGFIRFPEIALEPFEEN